MMRIRAARLAVAGACAIALTAVTFTAASAALPTTPAEPQQRYADTMTGDNLPTVQIDNGVVWDQAVVGNTVYAGGQFTQTRPAGAAKGTNLTARSNLLAYDITTGNLLPFNVPVNGTIKAVEASQDGKTLYIGGSFTQVGGQSRWMVAAIDLTTGKVSTTFKPAVGGSYVNAIAVSGTNVYVGGAFTQAAGVARKNLAAFTSGGALTSWAPTADGQIDGMVTQPKGGNIVIAGRFGKINGAKEQGTALINATSGAAMPWALNDNIATGVINGGQTNVGSMGLSADDTTVYGASWSSQGNGAALGVANIEGLWAADAATGKLVWMMSGLGDHYDTYANGSTMYGVGHSHELSALNAWGNFETPSGKYQHSIAFSTKAMGSNARGGYTNNSGKPAPALVHWYPSWTIGTYTGQNQAGWTVEGNATYVSIGGEFLTVNGKAQSGLTRFAKASAATKKVGPSLSGTSWEAPTFTAREGGGTVTIRPNFDRDDRTLTYQLYRSGTSAPVATTTFASDPWKRTTQTVTLTDTSAAGKTTYTYTVRAVDGDGNLANSRTVTGTTGAGGDGGGPVVTTDIAKDSFSGTNGSLWGAADLGGNWTALPRMTLSNGKGVISLTAPGQGHTAVLSSARAANVDLSVEFSMDKAGGPTYFTALARHSSAGSYRVKAVLNANQTVSLTIYKQVGSTQTTLASTVLPGYTYKAGAVLQLRFQATTAGSSTSLKAKAWPAGSEPAAWTVTASDSTAALQGAGQIGLDGYLSGSATNAPQTIRVDNLKVVAP